MGDDMKIDITELDKYNLLGYDRELRSFIMNFIDKLYPLSSNDMAEVLEGKETLKTRERKYVRGLLLEIKDEIIDRELKLRKEDLKKSYLNDTMNYEIKKSLEFKKEMLDMVKERYVEKKNRKL